ncbi:MAG: hypothetical protein WBG53_17195 [Rhodococcus sp. (in: high G+C Gram-positive bacteria)]|uniref:hypothetical protein n=1 Tax=unclassified Rhodococcus (in: high G+C Gram-positive bacteria) TaxID=192944 RepID=UPI000AFF075B|nr:MULTISPECIES: hypothetical protein [unclassified Rhodococcus (in: high G+C Gram-positive bacteria)]RMB78542.1 hypothetical protein AYK61_21080 [Rhodococcus sp. SBT000017]
MNSVTIVDATLIVEPRGLDKLWSFTRRLEIPLVHVRGATHDPGASKEPKGIRAPGLGLPGKTAGTFHRDGVRTFYNVTGSADTIVIELEQQEYQRLVLTVADPRAVVQSVNNAAAAA